MKPQEKRDLLRRLIEVEILIGYDISQYLGYTLSYFNWQAMQMLLDKRIAEYKENGGLNYE